MNLTRTALAASLIAVSAVSLSACGEQFKADSGSGSGATSNAPSPNGSWTDTPLGTESPEYEMVPVEREYTLTNGDRVRCIVIRSNTTGVNASISCDWARLTHAK